MTTRRRSSWPISVAASSSSSVEPRRDTSTATSRKAVLLWLRATYEHDSNGTTDTESTRSAEADGWYNHADIESDQEPEDRALRRWILRTLRIPPQDQWWLLPRMMWVLAVLLCILNGLDGHRVEPLWIVFLVVVMVWLRFRVP